MKINQVIISSVVTAALGATLLLQAGCSGSSSQAQEREAKSAAPQAVQVRTAVAEVRQVPVSVEATGSFVAEESSDVASEVEGQVMQTPLDVGALVRKGDVIVRLNPRDAELRLQQARAAEEQALAGLRQAQARVGAVNGVVDVRNVPEVMAARAQYESAQAQARLAQADEARYASLLKSGDIAQTVYDQARTRAETMRAQANAAREQYEGSQNAARQSVQAIEGAQAALTSARAQAAMAQKALADTVIRAPFAGAITDRPVSAGEWVTRMTKIATVVKVQPIELHLQVPEVEAARVRKGLSVTARVQAFPDRDFTGQITAINPAINPASRSFVAEATFANSDGALRTGMFATASIRQQEGQPMVFVPRSAVQADPNTDSYRVYVLQGDRARLRVVQRGRVEDGDQVSIATGLDGNVRVITSNLDQLYDGVQVQAR